MVNWQSKLVSVNLNFRDQLKLMEQTKKEDVIMERIKIEDLLKKREIKPEGMRKVFGGGSTVPVPDRPSYVMIGTWPTPEKPTILKWDEPRFINSYSAAIRRV